MKLDWIIEGIVTFKSGGKQPIRCEWDGMDEKKARSEIEELVVRHLNRPIVAAICVKAIGQKGKHWHRIDLGRVKEIEVEIQA